MLEFSAMAAEKNRKKASGGEKSRKKSVHPVVDRLLGQIAGRAEQLEWTYLELSKRSVPGAKGSSTWDGWRNGTSESPRVLDLERFANAVGLTVGLIGQDTSTTSEAGLTDDERRILGKLRSLQPQAQGFLLAKLEMDIDARLSSIPQELVADQTGHRGQ